MRSDKPVLFLCGHRKAGTTLFLSLFDGHPSLSVYPTDVTVLYAYFPKFVQSCGADPARRARLERLLASELRRLAPDHETEIERFSAGFDAAVAGRALDDMAAVLEAVVAGTTAMRGAGRWSVLKETSIEIYAAELLSWFPQARFIQLLRDPRDNYAALKAGRERYAGFGESEGMTLSSLVNRAGIGLRLATLNAQRFGADRYRVLRFEDLVANPRAEMEGLCRFLDIPFDPILLRPTLLGVPTRGNSYDGFDFSQVSTRNVGRWPERIAPFEAQVIEFHLGDLMNGHGYPTTFAAADQADAAAEFYKWENYKYHYRDSFAAT